MTPDPRLQGQVRAAFNALAPEHRDLLSLVHFHGLSLRQVADRSGMTAGETHRLAMDATLSFREALDDVGVEKRHGNRKTQDSRT